MQYSPTRKSAPPFSYASQRGAFTLLQLLAVGPGVTDPRGMHDRQAGHVGWTGKTQAGQTRDRQLRRVPIVPCGHGLDGLDDITGAPLHLLLLRSRTGETASRHEAA